ncbi:adenosine deaminase-like isoform X2 [Dermacentor albipictus]|uniref:adenosine deaminase-like isoform X2 n=1 Tax=Dermacentor albipictus TaxID=60249 RepID=UPI0031FC3180
MSFLKHFDPSKIPRTRVELHLHLDGSVRLETIWELAHKKKIDLGCSSIAALRWRLQKVESSSLKDFLDRFSIFMPTIVGDLVAIERIAYELCEDQAREGVAYFEARYSPHLLASKEKCVTPALVVQAVSRGLQRGEHDFRIKARSILTSVWGNDEWTIDCLKLCEEHNCIGVVGIDIAKDEVQTPGYTAVEAQVFQRAKQVGVPRTAHAGESGTYSTVRDAIVNLNCDRVGHGYRVFQDPTGETFAEDNVNFSINKDDSTITGSTLDLEYAFLKELGLTEAHIIRANINAARSCFLPHSEKEDLLQHLFREYGISPKKLA